MSALNVLEMHDCASSTTGQLIAEALDTLPGELGMCDLGHKPKNKPRGRSLAANAA